MKLKDEQGNEYLFALQIINGGVDYGCLYPVKNNPMPELEVGDWYQVTSGNIFEWCQDASDLEFFRRNDIQQVRKSVSP